MNIQKLKFLIKELIKKGYDSDIIVSALNKRGISSLKVKKLYASIYEELVNELREQQQRYKVEQQHKDNEQRLRYDFKKISLQETKKELKHVLVHFIFILLIALIIFSFFGYINGLPFHCRTEKCLYNHGYNCTPAQFIKNYTYKNHNFTMLLGIHSSCALEKRIIYSSNRTLMKKHLPILICKYSKFKPDYVNFDYKFCSFDLNNLTQNKRLNQYIFKKIPENDIQKSVKYTKELIAKKREEYRRFIRR